MLVALDSLCVREYALGRRGGQRLLNLLFSQRVVLEWHGRFSCVHLGCEDIVQAELPGKDVTHDMNSLLTIASVWEAIQDICDGQSASG